MTETTDRHPAPRTTSLLIHAAARYDFLVWLFTLGRERALCEKNVQLRHPERRRVGA